MRTLLEAACASTIAASAWLGTMFVVLHRPGYGSGVALSGLIALQSMLALAVANDRLSARLFRWSAGAGAVAIAFTGAAAVLRNLNRSHFEGFAVVIGVLLVSQGALTCLHLATANPGSSSEVHQFVN